jgi:hypothetical protein
MCVGILCFVEDVMFDCVGCFQDCHVIVCLGLHVT